MGRTKPLLPVRNKAAVFHCLDSIRDAGIRDILVVVENVDGPVARELAGHAIRIAVNPDPDTGMVGSVLQGMSALAENPPSGVLICLCDHPIVRSETISRLMEGHRRNPKRILIPTFQKKRGHPTLFPWDLLQGLRRGNILRSLIQRHPEHVELIAVPDAGTVMDMDTEEDYRKICRFAETADILPGQRELGSFPGDGEK